MRQIFVFLFTLCLTVNVQGQNENDKDCTFYFDSISNRNIYTLVDRMPKSSENSNLEVKIASGLEMDSIPNITDTYGEVTFIVETDGSISNINIINSVNKVIDQDVINYFKKTNKWKCGYCGETPVPVEMIIPYNFKF
ncbi:energy transducer TonB [Bacteroidota bacterium]